MLPRTGDGPKHTVTVPVGAAVPGGAATPEANTPYGGPTSTLMVRLPPGFTLKTGATVELGAIMFMLIQGCPFATLNVTGVAEEALKLASPE